MIFFIRKGIAQIDIISIHGTSLCLGRGSVSGGHVRFAGGPKSKLPKAISGVAARVHAVDIFLFEKDIIVAGGVLGDQLRVAAVLENERLHRADTRD